MKKLSTMLVMIFLAAVAYGQQIADVPPIAPPAPGDDNLITDVLNAPHVMPLGPYDLLQQYENQMAAISQEFGEELLQVLAEVQNDELDPDMANYISEHNYESAMMQFQLLSILHADLAKSIANAEKESDERIPAKHASPSSSGPDRQQTKTYKGQVSHYASAIDQGLGSE